MKYLIVKDKKLFVSQDGEVFFEKKGEGFLKEVHTFTEKRRENLEYKRCCFNGKLFYVHNLVAQLYIENPDNFKFVRHIDGDCMNNKVSNLKWVKGTVIRYTEPRKGTLEHYETLDPTKLGYLNRQIYFYFKSREEQHIQNILDDKEYLEAIRRYCSFNFENEFDFELIKEPFIDLLKYKITRGTLLPKSEPFAENKFVKYSQKLSLYRYLDYRKKSKEA